MRTPHHGLVTLALPLLLAALLALAPATRPDAEPTDQPVPKLSHGKLEPYYAKRHAEILARRSPRTKLLFLGASVIERWQVARADVYHAEYDKWAVDDFGVSGDKTQHILWRIANGELDGMDPKVVVVNTGNNIDDNTAEENVAGFTAVGRAVEAKLPHARVLLIPQMTRGVDPENPKVAAQRAKTKRVNAELAKLDDGDRTRVFDLGDRFLDADGVIRWGMMNDAIHPTAKGYRIWADAMRPTLDAMMAAPPLR